MGLGAMRGWVEPLDILVWLRCPLVGIENRPKTAKRHWINSELISPSLIARRKQCVRTCNENIAIKRITANTGASPPFAVG